MVADRLAMPLAAFDASCWMDSDLSSAYGDVLQELCCNPPKSACINGNLTAEMCCTSFHEVDSGGVCSRGCSRATTEGGPWMSTDLHWSMYLLALRDFSTIHKQIMDKAEMVLDPMTSADDRRPSLNQHSDDIVSRGPALLSSLHVIIMLLILY